MEVIDVSRISKDLQDRNAVVRRIRFPKVSLDLELKALSVNDKGWKTRKQIVLKKGGVQYGPYMPLAQGRYRIEVRGENLSVLSFSCHYLVGKKKVRLEQLKRSPEQVSYCINLPEKVENIEFIARNPSEQIAKLFSISLVSAQPAPW